ncbi:hypothetical protein [Metasolibacillus meyeri]|uniref:hypothetical protein n=1 Tax=Metasolibacillus meyeri TaxID=1071052 RepID=UPI000D301A49|nr:hypothetical protein [Metasolibacillus meyeri]
MEQELLEQQTIDRVSQIAAQQAIKTYEETKANVNAREYNKRLYNAKLLLKHYDELKTYVEKVDYKAKVSVPKLMISEKENIINLIEFGGDIVKSIKQTSQTTIAMIQYLDRALDTLEYIYKQENNARDFEIVKMYYFEKKKSDIVAERYSINKRSVYKIINNVAERLAILLFGIYGIKLE